MAIDSDGARVAYVLEREGVTQLYLHALDQPEPVLSRAQKVRSALSFLRTADGSVSLPRTD